MAGVVPAALGSLVSQQSRLLEADGGPSSLQGPRELSLEEVTMAPAFSFPPDLGKP